MSEEIRITKADKEMIWREIEREQEKIRRIDMEGNKSEISMAARRRHEIHMEALRLLYRETYYTY